MSEILPSNELLRETAAALAHRGCCGTEHDPANGKLHGYCVVCGVPWPCETAQYYLRPPSETFPALPQRYRVQQDKGEYALKGCADGDLVDWSAYEALLRRFDRPALKANYCLCKGRLGWTRDGEGTPICADCRLPIQCSANEGVERG